MASGLLSQRPVVLSAEDGNFKSLAELANCMRASMLLPGVTGDIARLKVAAALSSSSLLILTVHMLLSFLSLSDHNLRHSLGAEICVSVVPRPLLLPCVVSRASKPKGPMCGRRGGESISHGARALMCTAASR